MKTQSQPNGILVVLLLTIIISTFFNAKQYYRLNIYEKNNIDLVKKIDSLNDEIFNLQTEVGRYEITMDHLNEVNPKIGKEMSKWLNHNTE